MGNIESAIILIVTIAVLVLFCWDVNSTAVMRAEFMAECIDAGHKNYQCVAMWI